MAEPGWQHRVPPRSVPGAGSRGFGELVWSYTYLLLPSSSETASGGPAGAAPAVVGFSLFGAAGGAQGFYPREYPGAPCLARVSACP